MLRNTANATDIMRGKRDMAIRSKLVNIFSFLVMIACGMMSTGFGASTREVVEDVGGEAIEVVKDDEGMVRSFVRLRRREEERLEIFPAPHRQPIYVDSGAIAVGSNTAGDEDAAAGRGRRRRLQSAQFEVCGGCRCCDANQTVCVSTACCFTINCNDPKQPFGVCSLSPSICSCMQCPSPQTPPPQPRENR